MTVRVGVGSSDSLLEVPKEYQNDTMRIMIKELHFLLPKIHAYKKH